MTTHAVSSRLASSSSGSFDWIGTTSVNMNDERESGEREHRDDRALPRHPGESSSRVLILIPSLQAIGAREWGRAAPGA